LLSDEVKLSYALKELNSNANQHTSVLGTYIIYGDQGNISLSLPAVGAPREVHHPALLHTHHMTLTLPLTLPLTLTLTLNLM